MPNVSEARSLNGIPRSNSALSDGNSNSSFLGDISVCNSGRLVKIFYVQLIISHFDFNNLFIFPFFFRKFYLHFLKLIVSKTKACAKLNLFLHEELQLVENNDFQLNFVS